MNPSSALALVPALVPMMPNVNDLMHQMITALGPWALWVVAFIIFAECGLFSLLPGDSLLFLVGALIAGGGVDGAAVISYGSKPVTLLLCCLVLAVVALLGNAVGYWLGRLIGPPLFKPRKGLIGKAFDPAYVDKTHDFFERYGSRALILARFVPLVRTFVTLIAGVGKMNFTKFLGYSAIGAVIWAPGVTVLGYFIGNIPFVAKNIEYILVLVVVVSLIPMFIEYLNGRRKAKASAATAQAEVASDPQPWKDGDQ